MVEDCTCIASRESCDMVPQSRIKSRFREIPSSGFKGVRLSTSTFTELILMRKSHMVMYLGLNFLLTVQVFT